MGKASVNAQRGRLYLLAKLPSKNGDGWKAQRIPTGLPDTPANRKVADKRRALLQKQIDFDTFEWSDWTDDETKGTTWKRAIEALYKKRVVLGRTGQNTWDINYMGRLRQVDMNKVVNSREMANFVCRWDVSTCSYKEAYYLAKDLCNLIAIPFPELPLPRYTKDALTEVPEDHEIIDWIQRADPELAWAFGMLATYGLRPHELDDCEFIDLKHRLKVPDETKTGFRTVVPFPADWVELFELRSERRRFKTSTKPHATSQWLSAKRLKLGFPYKPYSLRHAYAGRLWKYGGSHLDVFTAARLMGHSVAIHEKTYREWIQPHTIAIKAEEALERGLADLRDRQAKSFRHDPNDSADVTGRS
jgi:integrase